MSYITEVLIAFIGGGGLALIIEAILSRRSRKAKGIKAYKDTIDMLMADYAKLISERSKLLKEISDAGIEIDPDKNEDAYLRH